MLVNNSLAHASSANFHACAFVMGPAEERAVIDPFLVEGMRRGEKAVYIVDPKEREEHDARLGRSAPGSDLLEVTTWTDAHLKGGSFDQDRMMEELEVIAATGYGPAIDRQQAHEAGYDCHFVKPVSVHDIVLELDRRLTVAAPLNAPGT